MNIKIIYEDNDLLVIDKPAGIIVFKETITKKQDTNTTTLIDVLIEKYLKLAEVGSPPRYGIIHRLDKDTSGVLLIAKNNEALIFLQKQFSADRPKGYPALADKKNSQTLEKSVEKRYIALVEGNIRENSGIIHTLIGRSPSDKRKQKAYPLNEIGPGKREAITEYKVLERLAPLNSGSSQTSRSEDLTGVENYTLLEVKIKTGRRHQIRCHFSYLQHPIAGDKLYSFKNSPIPENLTRQFLHAAYLKIQLPSGEIKEFKSDLPEELQKVLENLKVIS